MMNHDELDDFDDIDLDDIEDLDDGWDDLDDNDLNQASHTSRPKKKSFFSRLFTFLVIFIALAVGLFILYTTFKPYLTGGLGTNSSQNNVTQNNTDQSMADGMDDPLFVQGDGLPPMPTPLSGDQPMAGNPELTPLPEFNDIELEPLPDLDGQTNIDSVPMPAPIASVTHDDHNHMPSNDMTALEGDMMRQFDATDARLALLDDKMTRLESMMSRINEQLAAIQSAPKVMPVEAAPVVKTTTDWVPATNAAKPTYTAPKKTMKPKTVKKKVVKKKPAIRWQLRSAQPGKATVSPKGSNDIRSVTVGSTLSGIGRITSISNASGKWVVTGTTGKISQ